MDFKEYQQKAMRTVKKYESKEAMLANIGLGLAGESGEVADIIKKHLSNSKELDQEQLILELGDVLWYLAEACEYLNISLEDIANKNIEKLLKRHPDGFDGYGKR